MNAPQTITAKRRTELAALHNTNSDYLYQCLTGRRDMAPEEAMRLEIVTGGELHRSMLCQKRAHLIWPELAQREAKS
jgi:DNA-binding transcriptional regulator YdaS (Cro superfamily)